MAIRKFLDEYGSDEETDLYSKAKRLVGVVESAISNLGLNHRDHLVKKLRAPHDSNHGYRAWGGFNKLQCIKAC